MQNFLFTSDIFRGSRYEKGHPLDMDRVWPSVELIRLMGWVKEDQIIKNSPADISELIKFHDLDYVKALKKAEEDQNLPDNLKKKFNIGVRNNPIFSEVFSRPARRQENRGSSAVWRMVFASSVKQMTTSPRIVPTRRGSREIQVRGRERKMRPRTGTRGPEAPGRQLSLQTLRCSSMTTSIGSSLESFQTRARRT